MKKILYYIFITVLIPVLLCQCTIKKKDTSAENNNDPHCGKLPILGYPLLDGRQSAPV